MEDEREPLVASTLPAACDWTLTDTYSYETEVSFHGRCNHISSEKYTSFVEFETTNYNSIVVL